MVFKKYLWEVMIMQKKYFNENAKWEIDKRESEVDRK